MNNVEQLMELRTQSVSAFITHTFVSMFIRYTTKKCLVISIIFTVVSYWIILTVISNVNRYMLSPLSLMLFDPHFRQHYRRSQFHKSKNDKNPMTNYIKQRMFGPVILSDVPYFINESIFILGMTTNSELTINSVLSNLQQISCVFNNSAFLFYESNSNDRTLQRLNLWKNRKYNCHRYKYYKNTNLHPNNYRSMYYSYHNKTFIIDAKKKYFNSKMKDMNLVQNRIKHINEYEVEIYESEDAASQKVLLYFLCLY